MAGFGLDTLYSVGEVAVGNARLEKEVRLYEGRTLDVQTPRSPLATGALELVKKDNPEASEFYSEAYHTLRKVAYYWQKRDIKDFYVSERIDGNDHSFQIFPYTKEQYASYQQLKNLWNHIVPSVISIAQNTFYGGDPSVLMSDLKNNSVDTPGDFTDSFYSKPNPLDKEQKEKQLIYKGTNVSLLLDNTPLVPANFLVITHSGKRGLLELTETEYSEAMEIASKLNAHFQTTGIRIIQHNYFANGPISGMSVPEWHLKIAISEGKLEETWGLLKVVGKMAGLVKSLTDEQLKDEVQVWKLQFTTCFSK